MLKQRLFLSWLRLHLKTERKSETKRKSQMESESPRQLFTVVVVVVVQRCSLLPGKQPGHSVCCNAKQEVYWIVFKSLSAQQKRAGVNLISESVSEGECNHKHAQTCCCRRCASLSTWISLSPSCSRSRSFPRLIVPVIKKWQIGMQT